MFKKITAIVDANRDDITRKAIALGGITLGFIASSLVTKGKNPTVIVVEETSSEPATAPEPEAPKAEEK